MEARGQGVHCRDRYGVFYWLQKCLLARKGREVVSLPFLRVRPVGTAEGL